MLRGARQGKLQKSKPVDYQKPAWRIDPGFRPVTYVVQDVKTSRGTSVLEVKQMCEAGYPQSSAMRADSLYWIGAISDSDQY